MPTPQFHAENTIPSSSWIWVFSSNEKGTHSDGAAKVARVNFRAGYGESTGRTGQAYAIPTTDKRNVPLSLDAIEQSVAGFIDYAISKPKLNFFVTRIGGLLAGYGDEQIASWFSKAPANCSLPEVWKPYCAGVPA